MINQSSIHRVHCIGVGGIGVSGIAEMLVRRGYAVSGSDVLESVTIRRLREIGVTVYLGHDAGHVDGVDAVIYSSAITPQNPEYQAALARGVPVFHRGAVLASLMKEKRSVAVSGTHGKTTTSSLLSLMCYEGGLDPSFVLGGVVQGWTTTIRCGEGDVFVAEADESDASFLQISPDIAVVTNIDMDHLHTYGGDFKSLQKTFLTFMNQVSPKGCVVACLDDPVLPLMLDQSTVPVVTYGVSSDATYQITNFTPCGLSSDFVIVHRETGEQIPIHLNIPGLYNAQNATAAFVVARMLGVDSVSLQRSLSEFPGVERRFHYRGEMSLCEGRVPIYEDYGHHPSEVAVTLKMMRQSFPDQRLVLVFQPHRYTRTRDLLSDFVRVLGEVDELILLGVYSAGESAIPGADSAALGALIQSQGAVVPHVVEDSSQLLSILQEQCRVGDVVLLQGAGNVGAMAEGLLHDAVVSDDSASNQIEQSGQGASE